MSISSFSERHPAAFFFALAFPISWSGILLVTIRIGGAPGTKEQFAAGLPAAIPALLGGSLLLHHYEKSGAFPARVVPAPLPMQLFPVELRG